MSRHIGFVSVTLCMLLIVACTENSDRSSSSVGGPTPVAKNTTSEDTSSADEGTEEVTQEEEVPALEPFDPPPLTDLEAQVTWADQRVVDTIELRREAEKDHQPLVTIEEALRMRNDSLEANQKILSALGQLPPVDDQLNSDRTLIRHLNGDVKTTNPIMVSSGSDFEISNLTSFGIFGFDWEMKPLATSDVAVSWQTSDDGLYDKVVLRDDLTWSDGEPITAHDVAFSFHTIMNPKVPVPAMRSGTDQLRWVHAYDDQTVVYFHKKSSPTNIWNVNYAILPKHIYEQSLEEDPTLANSEYHVQLEQHPVSGGPYVVTKRIQGQEILLERRDDWFKKDGELVRSLRGFKKIRCRVIDDPNTSLLALRAGEIEETMITAEQWMTDQTNNDEFYEKNTKVTGVQWVEFHFNWNCKTPFFSDKRVRQAMSFTFDHDEMLDKLFYALYEPATGPFHPSGWMAAKNLTPYKQDLDKAEDLLDAAGWADSDGDGIRDKMIGGRKVDFDFTILCSTTPNGIKVCELMKQNLDQIGIVCNVKPLEFTVLMQIERDHKFQAAMGGWGTGTDPDTMINIFGSGENRNYGEYSNEEVDGLFEQGRKEFDPVKRGEVYAKIHKILYDDQPYTWLFWRNSFYGFNRSLRGFKFSPRGPYGYSPGFNAIWQAAR